MDVVLQFFLNKTTPSNTTQAKLLHISKKMKIGGTSYMEKLEVAPDRGTSRRWTEEGPRGAQEKN